MNITLNGHTFDPNDRNLYKRNAVALAEAWTGVPCQGKVQLGGACTVIVVNWKWPKKPKEYVAAIWRDCIVKLAKDIEAMKQKAFEQENPQTKG